MAKVKAQVIADFTDRENFANVYHIGDAFEGTQERVDELIASGHVKPIDSRKKSSAKEQ